MSQELEVKKIDPQEIGLVKNIADKLHNYAVSGDKRTEHELIAMLNERPSIIQRFFPTQGHKASQKLAEEELKIIVSNRRDVVAIHQAMYMAATQEYANVMIKGLSLELQKQLAIFANIQIKEIQMNIASTSKEVLKDLAVRERDAIEEFAGLPEKYLKNHLLVLDDVMSSHMSATKELLEGAISALKRKAEITK